MNTSSVRCLEKDGVSVSVADSLTYGRCVNIGSSRRPTEYNRKSALFQLFPVSSHNDRNGRAHQTKENEKTSKPEVFMDG
jgi:hypothetical protein